MDGLGNYESSKLNDALTDLMGAGSSPINVRATVTRKDASGVSWAMVNGKEFPLQGTTVQAQPGESVNVSYDGVSAYSSGNYTDPAIGAEAANGAIRAAVSPVYNMAQKSKEEAEKANKIAGEAAAVASATNQHFWDDTNGAHVTDVTQDEWHDAEADDFSDASDSKPYHNLLMNSLGILLRTALKNLVSITRSAIAFFDGTGNESSNIVARFGSDGAQIGYSGESHMTLDYHSTQMVDKEGNTYFYVSDLRDASGYAWVTDTFVADDTRTYFWLSLEAVDTNYTVTVNNVAVTTGVTKKKTVVQFDTAPLIPQIIRATYRVDSELAKAYTLGIRSSSGSVGAFSIAEGYLCNASGLYSHAEGTGTHADGISSHAEGELTSAIGKNSHAEGYNTYAKGQGSHAEGYMSQATGLYSHAEGHSNATTDYSHAEGLSNASGKYAHAEGHDTSAQGEASHASGYGTAAASGYQTAIGKYNIIDANDEYALIIGNGSISGNVVTRSNAYTIDWDGNGEFAGDVTAAAYNGTQTASEGVLASSDNQTALGKYNIEDTNGDYALIIGNGTADDARSNAMAVNWQGTIVNPGPTMNDAVSSTPSGLQIRDPANMPLSQGAAVSSNTYGDIVAVSDMSGDQRTNRAHVRYVSFADGRQGVQLETSRRKADGTMVHNGVQLFLAADGTRSIALTEAAPWRTALGLGTFATKNNLTASTSGVTATAKNSAAVSANSNFTVDVTVASPTGKKLISVLCVSIAGTGTGGATLRGFDANGLSTGGSNTVKTYWRTTTAISANAATVTVQILTLQDSLS